MNNEYLAPTAIAPYETIEEAAADRNIAIDELGQRMGDVLTDAQWRQLKTGALAIDDRIAHRLEEILNISASFWIHLEQHYQETIARSEARTSS